MNTNFRFVTKHSWRDQTGQWHLATRKEVENPALRALRNGVIVGLANHTVLISRDGSERVIDDSKQNVYLLPDDQLYVDKDAPTFTAFAPMSFVSSTVPIKPPPS